MGGAVAETPHSETEQVSRDRAPPTPAAVAPRAKGRQKQQTGRSKAEVPGWGGPAGRAGVRDGLQLGRRCPPRTKQRERDRSGRSTCGPSASRAL